MLQRIIWLLVLSLLMISSCHKKCKTVGTTRCKNTTVQVCSGGKEWIDVMDCEKTGAKLGKALKCRLDSRFNVFSCQPGKDK